MLQTIFDWMRENSPVILLGIFGGLVRQINEKQISTKMFVCGMITSVFVALLIFFAIIDTGIPLNLKIIIIGISGYSAVQILGIINNAVLKWLQKYAENQEDKKR
jgi:small basic protein